MQTQVDLFEVGSDVDIHTVFPRFYTDTPIQRFLGRQASETENRAILEQFGFVVGSKRNHAGSVLVYPVGPKEEIAVLFEVKYPAGWRLTETLNDTVYLGDSNRVRQLLDNNGHLRGVVHCLKDGVPYQARIYTRYAIVEDVEMNFSNLPFEQDGDIRSVVVDRTKINRFDPSTIPEVEHIDRLWLLGHKYPHLIEMSEYDQKKWIARHITTEQWATMLGVSGSSYWLDERFPDWKNPAAYWPQ